MRKTIHDRLFEALIMRYAVHRSGYSTSKKYTVMEYQGRHYWLGKSRALRVGSTIAKSIPADSLKAQLLAEVPA